MEVYYDFELDDTLEKPANIDNFFHKSLRDFLKSRYNVLEDEINKIAPTAFVVIILKDGNFSTLGYEMPDYLKEKVKNCITEDDYCYIIDKIWHHLTGG